MAYNAEDVIASYQCQSVTQTAARHGRFCGKRSKCWAPKYRTNGHWATRCWTRHSLVLTIGYVIALLGGHVLPVSAQAPAPAITPNSAGRASDRDPVVVAQEAVKGGVPAIAQPRTMAEVWQVAGDRAPVWRLLWEQTSVDQRAGVEFLLQNMPESDLRDLTPEFIRENVELAYQVWRESPWKSQVSEETFLNYILPYANINERRDPWRKDFYQRFRPLVQDAKSPTEAATRLNQQLFPMLKVRYSTKRRRADQGPFESIDSGLASCTGLSILLIDACRAMGVPARFVGTPLWSDGSGNHSWVEIWDQGWHFTGAAEPSGDQLDQAWFIDRASRAVAHEPHHAIYAVSFRRTPIWFPLVWDRNNHSVPGINVTERYTATQQELRAGTGRAMFRVVNSQGERQACALRVLRDTGGDPLFVGTTKDERFDANDHLTAVLPLPQKYRIELPDFPHVQLDVTLEKPDQVFTLRTE